MVLGNRSSAALVALAALATACGGKVDSGIVTPTVETIDMSRQPLGVGALLAVNGTYGAGCIDRTGSWSALISGSGTLTNPPLSVVTNNTDCQLTLTSLDADQSYPGTPTMLLTSAYAGSASSFKPDVDGSPGPIAFYANAKLSSTSFASGFVLSIMFSDDPHAVAQQDVTSGGYAAVSVTTSTTSVSSPDYTIDLTTDALDFFVDADNVITSVSGKADLVDGSHTGAGYVIDLGTLGATPTYAELDAAYVAGTATAIGGANPKVNGSSLGLVGADTTTPVVRTIIVARTVSGIPAYETFTLRFLHP